MAFHCLNPFSLKLLEDQGIQFITLVCGLWAKRNPIYDAEKKIFAIKNIFLDLTLYLCIQGELSELEAKVQESPLKYSLDRSSWAARPRV